MVAESKREAATESSSLLCNLEHMEAEKQDVKRGSCMFKDGRLLLYPTHGRAESIA